MPDLTSGWTERQYGFFIGVLLGDGCIMLSSISWGRVKIFVDRTEKDWAAIAEDLLEKLRAS